MDENLAGQTADRDPYSPDQLLAAAKTRLAHAEVALVRAEADGRKGGFLNGLGLSLALRKRNEAKRALAREEEFQARATSECPACMHDWSGVFSDRQVSKALSECPAHAGMLLHPVRDMEADFRAHAAELRAERAECRVAILERAASAEFEREGCVDVGTSEVPNPVRIRSTQGGIEEIRGYIARLEERALQAEANLRDTNARCRQFEKRAERADWIAGELRRDEFQWQDSIPVDEMNGKRILVQVRGTEGGIKKIKAFIAREEHASDKLHENLLAAEARIRALEAERGEAIRAAAASRAGQYFEVAPGVDARTADVLPSLIADPITPADLGDGDLADAAEAGVFIPRPPRRDPVRPHLQERVPAMSQSPHTTRTVSHAGVREAALRLIAGSFRRDGERPA